MTRYRKSWTQVIEEVQINEALKKIDKDVIDAFYYKKEKAGKVVSTDGDSLWKNGLGGQEIAIWTGRKIKITAVSDVKSTESIIKYMKKSIPSGLFEEEVEATRMPMEAPFVLVEKDEDEGYGGTDKWKKGQKKLKKAGIKLHKKDRASGYVEGVTGPTRMDVQKHFDKEKGLLRARINATEKALKISDMKVDAKGTVQSFKEEVELDEKWEAGVVYHQDFGGGEISYFRADSLLKNKRWKGMSVDEYGGKQKKPRNITADEKTPGWKITPKDKIPKGLKEEVEIDEKFAGWIAFYNKDKLEIKPKKGVIDSLNDAKQAAIKHFKVPKSKQGLLAIEPAYEEVELEEAFSMGKGDKRVVDAFYDQKEIKAHGASILTTDGKTLTKRGMGGQDIAKWVNGKIKIVAVSDVKSTELILKYMKKSIPSGVFEEVEIDESTKEYAKSLEKIARDRQISILSKSDKTTLLKIAALLDKEKKEEVELDEDQGDEEHRELVQFKARWLMKQALKSGKRQNQAWWNKQARIAGFERGADAVKVLTTILDTQKEDVELDEAEIATSIGSGGTAGLDMGLTYKKKKEDVKKAKALRKQMVGESVQRTTFAGKDVFIVDSETYYNCRLGKKKYGRYEKYVGKGKVGQTIREYGLKYPRRPIILQNGESGPMLFLKYGRS